MVFWWFSGSKVKFTNAVFEYSNLFKFFSAAACTHPLDLLKVHLQTVTSKSGAKQVGIVKNTVSIIKTQGVLALYNGISASMLRQLTYSTARFAFYEAGRQQLMDNKGQLPFYQKVLLAANCGAAAAVVGKLSVYNVYFVK